MSRRKGYGGVQARQRERLENALGALVRIEILTPIARLRIEQASKRPGVGPLLQPALCDLDDVAATVQRAKAQIGEAIASIAAVSGG